MSKLISKYLKGKPVLSEEMYNKIGHTQIPILVKQILDKYRDVDEYSFDDILSKHPDLTKYLNNIQLDYARAYYDESKKRRNFKRDIAITNTPEAQKILNPEINPEEIDRQFVTAEKNRELRAKEIQDWREQQWAENVLRGYGYSEEKLKNPNIKAHAIALANNLIKREEAGKQYMKTVIGGTVGLMGAPYLVTTSIPTLAAIGGGIVGGKAVDKGTNLISKNKYEGWGDMVSDKLTGNKESGWLFDFTNPGYFAGGFAGNRLVTGNFGRSLAFSTTMNKGIKNSTLDRYVKFDGDNLNQNVRFKLGDVEINNPNLFYRQGDGPLAEDLIESGIVRTKDTGKKQIIGTINLTKPVEHNAMFNKGKVAFSPESNMGKNLIVTSASNKLKPTQPKTWTGKAVYINDWRSNPITKQEATGYIFEPGYGYRNANTLNLNREGTPFITEENAASITREQWTAAQDAAIARGDMAEAQRLSDLHAATKGRYYPGYHGNMASIESSKARGIDPYTTERDPNLAGGSPGYFNSSSENVANTYNMFEGAPTFKTYTFMDNPYIVDANGRTWQSVEITQNPSFPHIKQGISAPEIVERVKREGVHDGVIIKNVMDVGPSRANLGNASDIADDIVGFPGRVKLADAVTYDDNGVRIPLGERHNFKLNDKRYSWLPPFIGLGTLGTMYGTSINK